MFYSTKRYLIYLFLIVLLFYTFTLNFLFCKNDCSSCLNEAYRIDSNKPTIYLITPTYDRYEQLAELTRLSQTLLLVNKLYWIIIEDSRIKSDKIKKFITNLIAKKLKLNSDLKIEHLNVETPVKFKIASDQPNWSKPKGVWQRNRALEYLTINFMNLDRNGVIYFLDDDNTYDIQIFEEMRNTKRVSVWPVGLAGQLLVEQPILNKQNQVIGFNSVWKKERQYPIDMAGFAINLSYYILKSSPKFYPNLQIGYQETYLLNQLLDNYSQLEPKANNCTLVWHTQTVKFRVSKKAKDNVF